LESGSVDMCLCLCVCAIVCVCVCDCVCVIVYVCALDHRIERQAFIYNKRLLFDCM
jgi:hypothetical protein